jgi:hypothetical protein
MAHYGLHVAPPLHAIGVPEGVTLLEFELNPEERPAAEE